MASGKIDVTVNVIKDYSHLVEPDFVAKDVAGYLIRTAYAWRETARLGAGVVNEDSMIHNESIAALVEELGVALQEGRIAILNSPVSGNPEPEEQAGPGEAEL